MQIVPTHVTQFVMHANSPMCAHCNISYSSPSQHNEFLNHYSNYSSNADHVICLSNGQTVFRNFKYAICEFIVIATVSTVQVPIYDCEYSTVDVHCLLYCTI